MRRLVARMKRCARCGRNGPPVFGEFEPGQDWMLVGQAPGREEVRQAVPFVGPAGRRLFEWLKEAGFEEQGFRSMCYVTAVYKCYPGKGGHGDLKPNRSQLERWAHFLDEEFDIVQPGVLILVGSMAIDHFLGHLPLASAVGREFKKTIRGLDVTVIPLPHPSGASAWPFQPGNRKLLSRALRLIAAAATCGRDAATGRALQTEPASPGPGRLRRSSSR
jgi:uracil-DNA glycosylase